MNLTSESEKEIKATPLFYTIIIALFSFLLTVYNVVQRRLALKNMTCVLKLFFKKLQIESIKDRIVVWYAFLLE